jgi:hypothetical protein
MEGYWLAMRGGHGRTTFPQTISIGLQECKTKQDSETLRMKEAIDEDDSAESYWP